MKARRIFAENLKSSIVRHQLYIEIKQKIEKSPARFHPGRAASFSSGFDLHPASQSEHDPVLDVHRHAVNQRCPQALVELGDELRQVLYALDEALDLPAADHDLVDLLDDGIALSLGIFIPADERVVALVVLFLVLKKKQASQLTKFAV